MYILRITLVLSADFLTTILSIKSFDNLSKFSLIKSPSSNFFICLSVALISFFSNLEAQTSLNREP